jgi:hypothetical protein
MVASENDDEFRRIALNDVNVLSDSVRRADVPLVLRDAL